MTNLNLLSTPAVGSTSGRPQSVSASETPLKQNMSSKSLFTNGSLEDQREDVRDNLGPLPEVTVNFMLEHIIPNSNVDVEATMKVLNAGGIWLDTGGWKQFEGLSPRQLARKKLAANKSKNTDINDIEAQVFGRMKDLYDTITSSTKFFDQETRAPTLHFDQSPNSGPVSNTNIKTGPDCCGVLTKQQKLHSSHEYNPSTTSSQSNGAKGNRGESKHKDPDSDRLNWFDIACVEEYKLNDKAEDINDNILKILWSLHRIMGVDHRRRFSFGLTIENENVRIWFCCRQIVLVTQQFNFRTNASQLVQLIASLAYATPAQLGYDPTMTLKWRNNDWHYDIELTTKHSDGSDHTVLYRTIEVLSNTAYKLRGRATRVYLAVNSKDDTDPLTDRRVVLKDSWIDTDRPKEGDTLTQLLEGASEEERALFLTIYQHGIVQVDNQDDSTQGLILKGQIIELPANKKKAAAPIKFNYFSRRQYEALGIILESPEPAQEEQVAPENEVRIFHLFTPKTAANTRSSTSKTSNSASEGMLKSQSRNSDSLSHNTHHVFDKPIVYSPKVHYRIAFEEVGESLMQIAGSGMATTRILDRVLCDITMALKYMAKKGYVHRDVSAGNILLFEGRAKLSDLEFARKYGAGASSYVRMGTYNFMAGEVIKGKYSVEKYANQNASVPFVHNPIHDLESLWWVGVWCSMWHYPAPFTKVKHSLNPNNAGPSDSDFTYTYEEFDDKTLAHIKLVRNGAEELFPSQRSWIDNVRTEEIHSRTSYPSRGANGYPEEVAVMVFRLNNMRQCISWAYMKTQKDLPRTKASYFTDVLRVSNPLATLKDDEEEDTEDDIQSGIRIPVHDRIVQVLDALKGEVDVEDAILWPLDSIEYYREWLETQEMKPKK